MPINPRINPLPGHPFRPPSDEAIHYACYTAAGALAIPGTPFTFSDGSFELWVTAVENESVKVDKESGRNFVVEYRGEETQFSFRMFISDEDLKKLKSELVRRPVLPPPPQPPAPAKRPEEKLPYHKRIFGKDPEKKYLD